MKNTNIPSTTVRYFRASTLNIRLYYTYIPVTKACVLILPCTIISKVLCSNENTNSDSPVCLASNVRVVSESAQYCTVL